MDIKTAIMTHPVTCLSLTLNVANVIWCACTKQWGLSVYWAAAAQITFAATWLRGWES